jgi:hypothetical protein
MLAIPLTFMSQINVPFLGVLTTFLNSPPMLSSIPLYLFLFFVLGFELRAYTLSHSTSLPFCVLDFVEIGSLELFAWAGLTCDPPDLFLLSS